MAPAVSSAEFRAAMASFASGVTIVTTLDEAGTPYGLTATALCSVCKEPPTCLVCVAHAAEAHSVILSSKRFGVNILSASQQAVSAAFATSGVDKFSSVSWHRGGVLGCPLIADSLAAFECQLTACHTAGDHDVLFGVLRLYQQGTGAPLVYYRGHYADIALRAK